jgi:hypothetical protein
MFRGSGSALQERGLACTSPLPRPAVERDGPDRSSNAKAPRFQGASCRSGKVERASSGLTLRAYAPTVKSASWGRWPRSRCPSQTTTRVPRSLAFGDRRWKPGRSFILESGAVHRLTSLRSSEVGWIGEQAPCPVTRRKLERDSPLPARMLPAFPLTAVYTFRIYASFATGKQSLIEE